MNNKIGGNMERKVTVEMEQGIIKDYLSNKYSEARVIGVKYGIPYSTVLRILKDNGIEIKSRRTVNSNLIDNYFEVIDSEAKAYMVGFLFADGSIQSNGYLNIHIHNRDIELLERFKSDICSGAKITTQQRGNSLMSRMSFKSKKMCEDLSKYGIIPNKTELTNHLPIDMIPREYWRHFLRGLVDGDGWVCYSNALKAYKMGFVTRYESTAQDFVFMINELIDDKWTNKIVKDASGARAVKVQIQRRSQVEQLARALYENNTICLSRKYKIAKEIFEK